MHGKFWITGREFECHGTATLPQLCGIEAPPSLGRAAQILNGGAKISGPKESHAEQDVNASLGRRGILGAGELRNSSKNQANKQQTKQESKPGDDSVWRPVAGRELHQAVFAKDYEHST